MKRLWLLFAFVLIALASSCVQETPPSITISPDAITIHIGQKVQINATIETHSKETFHVIWSSSDPWVATVDDGMVEGNSVGAATITVSVGGMEANCEVTVIPVEATGISMDVNEFALVEGGRTILRATIEPSNVTDKTIVWYSSDPLIASVNQDGEVIAISPGTATIIARTGDGKCEAQCKITVRAIEISVKGVQLDRTVVKLVEGGTASLYATVIPSTATNKSVTWTSSDPSIASIVSAGDMCIVTAHSAGSATITVTTDNLGKAATCEVTVEPKTIAVTSVILNRISLTLTEGDAETLTATVYPTNATNKTVTWSSSNTSVAAVSASGVITAKSVGNATITVITSDGAKKSTCSVTVTAKVISVTSVSLDKTSLTLTEGDTETLTATVYPTNATNKSVTWSSSNTPVATVSASGVITAKAAGSTTINVTTADGSKTATCYLTVQKKPVPVTGVSLNNTSLSMAVGDTKTLVATVSPSNATDKTVTWSSNNTSVLTVSSSGTITAKAVGTATITVTTSNLSIKANCSVSVVPVSVTGISLNKYSLSMYENDTETLIATITPSNATDKTITWYSDNTVVASVNSYGQVQAKAAGTAIISATTADGKKTASCSVTVTADPYGAVDLGLSVKWSSFNYGASSITAVGGYYLWGDPSGTAYPFFFDPPSVNSISGTAYDVVRKNWGGNWRIPTRSEINELYSNCTWTSTTVNGVSVIRVTGRNGASIYLPYTGYGMPDDGPVGTVVASDTGKVYMMSGESYGDSYGRFVYVYNFTSSGSISSVSYNAAFASFPIRPVR